MPDLEGEMKLRATLITTVLLLWGCASNKDKNDAAALQVKGSNDILDLLTGFGESVSRRNFERAVQYLVPEDRAKILDAQGHVPEDKQRAMTALSLQRLIRTPGVRVEGGYLAGIYDIIAREEAGSRYLGGKGMTLDSTQAMPNPLDTSPQAPNSLESSSPAMPSPLDSSSQAAPSSLPADSAAPLPPTNADSLP